MAKLNTWTRKLPVWLFACALSSAPACNATRLDTDEYPDTDGLDMSMADYRRDLSGVDLKKPRDRDAACASVKAEATLGKKPVDIIFVIDNSGSMADEILAVQNNINKNFADIIGKSGLDYRVIMVTRHGKYNDALTKAICVEAPLSTVTSCSTPPAKPGINPGKFYHYSIQVESTDSMDRLLKSFDARVKDEHSLAPMGWSQWARPDAFKVFIEITDDRSAMTAAAFENALLALPGKQFGSVADRNYVWHSIIGLKENSPATKAWQPTDPVQMTQCAGGSENPGIDYQNLSIATKGLRFPVCQHASYDAVFLQVAMGVIAGTKVACDFPLPMPPPGQKVDLDSVSIDYTPMGMGAPTSFKQVPNLGACGPNSFYISGDRIHMCPETCADVQKDSKAKVEVLFDCLSIIG